MARVLVTGGAGAIGAAVVRRLLRDPQYDVRVSDQRRAPQWMREGCEIHHGDLRDLDESRKALQGCTHVIHLAAMVGAIGNAHKLPCTLTEVNNALNGAVVRAALDQGVDRFVYVSSPLVFEQATEFPTTEEHIFSTPVPRSPFGFSKLGGEVYVRAAHAEHGLPYTICRPFNAYGPGELPDPEPGSGRLIPDLIRKCLEVERAGGGRLPLLGDGSQTRTLTHVDDIADGIVTAMSSPDGQAQDFNIASPDELTVEEIARTVWELCGLAPKDFAIDSQPAYEFDVVRRYPSVEKARDILGWSAQIELRDGLAQTISWLRSALPVAA